MLLIGFVNIPVAQCDQKQEYGAHPKVDMRLCDYITYLEEARKFESDEGYKSQCLYLKDWHFVRYHDLYC